MATETTDRQAQGRGAGNRAPARGPRASTTALGALSVFMGAFAFLSFQMGSGKDPALGAGTPVAAAPAPVRRQVIVRKVVITKVRRVRVVVHERVPTQASDRSIPVVNHVAVPAAAAPPKPVSHTATTTHTAPAPAPKPKPAPAAAPKPAAPAPAPAPPTTHQS